MRAHTLSASAGWRWIVAGFAIYRQNPILLSVLVSAYWFLLMCLNALPAVGTLIASALAPALSVGLLRAIRQIERQDTPRLAVLWTYLWPRSTQSGEASADAMPGFSPKTTRTLIGLGLLYLLLTLSALGLSTLADGGALFEAMLQAPPDASQSGDNTPEPDELLWSLGIIVLFMTPVLMAYWFAPALAAWHDLGLAKALFFSLYACWINWRPFLVYGLALTAVAALLPGLLLALVLTITPLASGTLISLVTFALLFSIAPAVYASFYASYREVFSQPRNISEIV